MTLDVVPGSAQPQLHNLMREVASLTRYWEPRAALVAPLVWYDGECHPRVHPGNFRAHTAEAAVSADDQVVRCDMLPSTIGCEGGALGNEVDAVQLVALMQRNPARISATGF